MEFGRLGRRIGVAGIVCAVGSMSASAAYAALPDNRSYEEVSPASKNAADVVPHPLRTRAAADGDAVQFASFVGFGDVRGGSLMTEYIATRDSTRGTWASHAISPREEPLAFPDIFYGAFEPRYVDEFSADLSQGVYMPTSLLTDAPNVADVANLYLRDDLLTPGPGSYQLLTDAATSQSAFRRTRPWLAGASRSFDRVYFESQLDLTPDSAGLPLPSADCLSDGGVLSGGGCDASTPKLYEWVAGSVRLVGILPNGDPTLSQAGQGAEVTGYTFGAISQDGSRAVFTAPPFDGDQHGGALYVRDDKGTFVTADDTTMRVNTSERTDCNADPSCGGDGVRDPVPDPTNPGGSSRPAMFWAASGDASMVFFTSAEQLTDGDINHSVDLYRASLDAPPGDRLARLSVDSEPSDNTDNDLGNGHSVSGVIGASEDGAYVYFTVSNGQLVAGNPTATLDGGHRIYVWHGGALRQIGAVNGGEELERILGSPGGWNATSAKWSRVTPDGTHMAFITRGTDELLSLFGKLAYAHDGGTDCNGDYFGTTTACSEVYIYDAAAGGSAGGDLACASCNPTGTAAKGDADFYAFHTPGYFGSGTGHLPHVLSDDGRFVFFNTLERLQPEDQNNVIDAYEYDFQTRQAHLLSAGTGTEDSVFLDAAANGHDVFFTTRDRLRSTDVDQSRDLYDARIDGGFPEPPPKTPECEGEACQGPPTVAPAANSLGSSNFRGAGNVSENIRSTISGLRKISSSDRSKLAKGGKALLRLKVNRSGTVSVAGTAKLGKKNRRVVSSRAKVKKAGRVSIPFALSKSARSELSRKRSLTVLLTVRFKDARPKVVSVTLKSAASKKGGRS